MLLGKANILVNDRLTSMLVIMLKEQLRDPAGRSVIFIDFFVGLFLIQTDQTLPSKRVIGLVL